MKPPSSPPPAGDLPPDAIAIVGMSGRFPGAPNIAAFWQNLLKGEVSVTRFDVSELEDSFDAETRAQQNFVAARPVLADVDQFDAEFFGIYGREADLMDPQHRVFLEIAWEALESAGIDPQRYKGDIGVFAGASMPTYFLNNVCADRATVSEFTSNYQLGGFPTLLGALPDALATRVAYKFDLRGPAITVQSACSTSLLAVAQACQSLMLYQCDAALAGGVSITFPQKRGYLYEEGGMGARDGVCRPFDADAAGTIFGSGAGVVVLKRLEDAVADGDPVIAVIRGTAVNNDGAAKVGFTAPSVEGQARVIAAAHAAADIDPETIGYVELHGTATPLGDPIEFEGLKTAFGDCGGQRNFCVLGSAKGNIGHLDAAAGVTGLIKTALSLRHGEIPPMANYAKPNPNIDLAHSPFRILTETTPWPSAAQPRRAGVSSFGVGGTNVHVVLEEAPSVAPRSLDTDNSQILTLSARTDQALAGAAAALADSLTQHPETQIADVASTLQTGRQAMPVRGAIVAADRDGAIAKLRSFSQSALRGRLDARPPVIFMFPGQGAQFPGMGLPLYENEPVYREVIDRGAEVLKPLLGVDLRELLSSSASADESEPHPIRSTVFAQPALFLTEAATAKLWMSRGIVPDAMIGHSVGEFVAAYLAEVLSFEDALALVAARAQLMQSAPAGAMLAVRASESAVRSMLGANLDIAAINAPHLIVVAGPFDAINSFEKALTAADIPHRRLHTSHAFHSAMMDPVVDALAARAANVQFGAPRIPFVSCVTGEWATGEMVASPSYWARHCRETVRFSEALATVLKNAKPILLEVGPGRTLSTFALQGLAKDQFAAIVSSLPEFAQAGQDRQTFAEATARLWANGVSPDWSKCGSSGNRVALPTYPFQRKRHWIEPPQASSQGQPAGLAPTQFLPIPSTTDDSPMADTATTPTPVNRLPRLCAEIGGIIESLSGDTISQDDWPTQFLELGFDSLFLGQVAQQVQRKYSIKITFRQLLGEFPSIDALATHLDAALPADPVAAVAPASAPVPVAAALASAPAAGFVAPTIAAGNDMLATFQAQIAAMQSLFDKQLSVLGGGAVAMPANVAPAPVLTAPAVSAATQPAPAAAPAADSDAATPSRFRMFKKGGPTATMSDEQRNFVDEFARKVSDKMAGSKAYAAANRPHLADPRSASGFRSEWKEVIFPIVCDRAKGSRLWDIDGNEYIDLVNGYGQTAFGHSPDFVVDAVDAQLRKGFPIGPQSSKAGDVARRIAKMVGLDRVTFCNTGSEAVMAAMRVARAVTGRELVVMFANDYHGQFDEVLVKPGSKKGPPKALPISAGIPPSAVSKVIVLSYGEQESLDWIRQNAEDLAAVIVEPVQSRHPELRPVDFLKSLREITATNGAALVFDEVVTGFRTHPGGAQALFNIRADMATYGKVIGGGMPIGLLAGSAAFMDVLDGGQWSYGDDSVPETAPIFFAGTFVRHPLVVAATEAVVTHLENEGPALQERLEARTKALVQRLNLMFARRGVKTRAETFSSWFMINFGADDLLGSLFYAYVRYLGVNIQEGFPCFLTTAHSDEDFARIEAAFDEALAALQAVGVLVGNTDEPVATPAAVAAPQEPSAPPLPDSVPLTEMQQEVWMSAQMGDAASCAFNESFSLELDGELQTNALSDALNAVVERHDSLRAYFGPAGEAMSVRADGRLDIEFVDFSGDADPRASLGALLHDDARTPFDLNEGPLARAFLAKLSANKHVLAFTAHHIIFDGWSCNVLLGELASLYNARVQSKSANLPRPLSYRKYALDRASQEGSSQATRDFWLAQYRDIPELPELPSDRQRPAIRNFSGATYTAEIDAALARDVKKAGAKLGCTLFATLFACFQTLIGRLSDHSDVVVAVPTAGQSLLEDEILVGHCVNLLPVRAAFDPSAPFASHLANVKGALLQAFDHADYTFGALVRDLGAPRSPNRLPMTEVQFNLEKIGEAMAFEKLTAKVRSNPKAFSNFDMFFNVTESKDGLRIDCDYNTEIFDAATIERWIGHFRVLLKSVVDNPACPIKALPLMTDAETKWLTDTLNATTADYPRNAWLPDLIAEQALKSPNKIAVSQGGTKLSYQELNLRSNQMARFLRTHLPRGAGRVAVGLTRTPDMLVVLLAVMKAGYAYVPLDVDHPIARLRSVLDEAKVLSVIVDSDALNGALPSSVKPIHLATALECASLEEGDALEQTPRDETSAAYVIFTSGSTGAPKGVEVSHRSLINFLNAMAKRPGFTANDVIVAVTTLSFDIAGLELYLPLIVGGRVVIANRDDVRSGFGLVDIIESQNATVLQATPSLWRILLEANFKAPAGFKILCGGEALPRDLANALIETGAEVWNVYGPTETTIWSATGKVGSGPISIGDPIDNTQLFVLDKNEQLAVLGAPGRLFIGGDGLANGYFNRSDLTAAAFRTISIDGRPGQLLYDTGDLAKRLPDGAIQVLGRADFQVKLRGFRIELEEIEAAIRSAPGVAAAATALRGAANEPRLVGYYVLSAGALVTANELSAHVAKLLPDYMVPTAWRPLDKLPMTGNGKLDRKALPDLDPTVSTTAVARIAPRTPLETTLVEIWREVLGLQEIGVTESLFSLGADSLHIFRIAARMANRGIPLQAKHLLQHPTIAALAQLLDETETGQSSAASAPSLSAFRGGRKRGG